MYEFIASCCWMPFFSKWYRWVQINFDYLLSNYFSNLSYLITFWILLCTIPIHTVHAILYFLHIKVSLLFVQTNNKSIYTIITLPHSFICSFCSSLVIFTCEMQTNNYWTSTYSTWLMAGWAASGCCSPIGWLECCWLIGPGRWWW